MKSIILTLLTITALSASGQIDQYGQHFQDKAPEAYNIIKQHAVEKWVDNYEMVVYEINGQCKACYNVLHSFEKEHVAILYNAVLKWSYDGYEAANKAIMNDPKASLYGLHCNWEMIEYEYNNQVKAKESF